MPIYQAVILAVVQAITEFLPISSTAHLALVPWLLKNYGWHDPGLEFDVALHLGTLLAVLLYFWRLWVRVAFAGFGLAPPVGPARAIAAVVTDLQSVGQAGRPVTTNVTTDVTTDVTARAIAAVVTDLRSVGQAGRPVTTNATTDVTTPDEAVADRRLLWLLALGTIPAGLCGLAFEKQVSGTLRSPFVMATSLILVALLMALGERITRPSRSLKDMTLGDSLLVGCAQAVALIPGVSRSGITITAAMARDYRRDSAARFSFLLATPVVAGAALVAGRHLLKHGLPADMRLPFLLGVLVSALAGYAVIAFLIRYLQTHTLKIFIYYRLVFGLIILALAIFSSAP